MCSLSLLETEESHSVALPDLGLARENRLASNSQGSVCLCLLRAEIKGVFYHANIPLVVTI